VTVSVVNSLCGVADSKRLGAGLAVDVVIGAGELSEVGGFVDKSSTLGVGTSGRDLPEDRAEVDSSEASAE